MVPVPIHRSLPGVVVQALATECVSRRRPAHATRVGVLCGAGRVDRTLCRAPACARAGGAICRAPGGRARGPRRPRRCMRMPRTASSSRSFRSRSRPAPSSWWSRSRRSMSRPGARSPMRSACGAATRFSRASSSPLRTASSVSTRPASSARRTRLPARLFGCGTQAMIGAPLAHFIPQLERAAGEPARTARSRSSAVVSEFDARPLAGEVVPGRGHGEPCEASDRAALHRHRARHQRTQGAATQARIPGDARFAHAAAEPRRAGHAPRRGARGGRPLLPASPC